MIGQLVSKNVRTVYDKKVVRLKVDFPYYALTSLFVGDTEAMEWLDQRVGGELGVELTTLEDQEQETLPEGVKGNKYNPNISIGEMTLTDTGEDKVVVDTTTHRAGTISAADLYRVAQMPDILIKEAYAKWQLEREEE